MTSEVDILINNGLIITMDKNKTIFYNGSIAIKDNKILEVDAKEIVAEKYKADKVIDAANKMVIPGLINGHTHAGMSLLRGYADDLPLKSWLEEHIWPIEEKYMNMKNIGLGTKLAILEMVHAGITCYNDMYFHENKVAEVSAKAGIRTVIGEGLIDYPDSSNNIEEKFQYIEELLFKWKEEQLIEISVAPHSPYTCTPELLKRTKKFADQKNLTYHIHLAETNIEKNLIPDNNLTPTQYLESLDLLSDNVVAVHCVHLNKKDINLLKNNNVSVVHNPTSNNKLASGIAPVKDLIKANVNVCLGTDSAASNNNLDIFKEMKSASLIQKVINGDPTTLPAEKIFEMATINAAKALKIKHKVGSIEKNKYADIVIMDINNAHSVPMYDPYSHLVYAANSADVETVVVNGKMVMKNKEILTLDEENILNQVKQLARKIK